MKPCYLPVQRRTQLSFHILSADGEMLEQDGARTAIEPVESGEEVVEQLSAIVPTAAGEYILDNRGI